MPPPGPSRCAQKLSRGLAFYGAEDLTPSSFYSKEDAEAAFEGARLVVALAKPVVGPAAD